MSEQKTPQTQKVDHQIKKIEVGKFYLLFEGSESGHPGYIVWKNDDHNLYLAIKFGTSPNKNNTKLNLSLRKDDKENLIYKKLFLGKRKNIGKKELSEMNISDEQLKNILKNLDFLNPSYSPDINSKDRYQYKRNIKKSPHYKGQLSDPKGPADDITLQNQNDEVNKKYTK